jgi:hypothetical protein
MFKKLLQICEICKIIITSNQTKYPSGSRLNTERRKSAISEGISITGSWCKKPECKNKYLNRIK